MRSEKKNLMRLTVAGLCMALGLVLPFLTGQIPQIGKALSPMHIPVFLCGFLAGPVWGAAVGFITPLLRSVLFQMPVLYPSAISMAFELCTYGIMAGVLYRLLPKKLPYLYVSLIISMLCGRAVMGVANTVLYAVKGNSYTLELFLAGAFINAVPGIILHIVLVPLLVAALQKTVPALRGLNTASQRKTNQ